MKRKSMRMVTLVFLFVLIGFLLIPQPVTTSKGWSSFPHQYLTPEQYSILNEMLEVHINHFLNPMVITSTGLPLTAYKVGDRARFGYSNPTEWGYALQAWIAAAERGIISESEAVNRITLALATMRALQQNPDENFQSLFYPFYTMTDPGGNDLPMPVHDASDPRIPSGDLALLYASLLVTQGWANYIGNPTIETQASTIKDNMNFHLFLFQENGETYLAHQINADTGILSSSKWNIFADEGGIVTWIAFYSGSVSFAEFKALTESQIRDAAFWQSCGGEMHSVREATWFNAMFTLTVRSLAGFSIGDYDSPTGSVSRYSQHSLVPAIIAHLTYGDCLGVDYPAFSDAMTQAEFEQALVRRHTPPNLANITPVDPPNHVMPHALFAAFNAGPDLPTWVINRLIGEVTDLRDDEADYYHDDGAYPFGFEVIASPYEDDLGYNGADDGRMVFETLSQSYITHSLFNGLQLNDGDATFYTFATNVSGYEDALRQILHYLYPNEVYLPIVVNPPCTIGVFRFGSGSSQYPEEQSVSIDEACLQEGANIMILESVNPQQTNHWIFWDSLHLADAQGYVWQLGGDEAPPNYTSVAYDEFDATPPYNIDFYIGAMPEIEFPAELNDLSFSEVRIHFNLTESQADQDLILFLDTLYATHIGASYFDMRVKVLAENE